MAPFNAANRKDIRAAEKAQVQLSIVNREVICGIMQVANGRQWMYERLAEAQLFADPFTPDPLVLAYHTGLRKVGQSFFNDIMTYCPRQFELMLKEHNDRLSSSERVREPQSDGRDSGSELDGLRNEASGDHDPYAGDTGPQDGKFY